MGDMPGCKIEKRPTPNGFGDEYVMNVGTASYSASGELFSGNLDLSAKMRLFKQFVTRILIESSAYCNRQCTFCPNASGIRLTKEQRGNTVESTLLKSVVAALKRIDYDSHILLHLYNEPMADPNLAANVATITSELPNAIVRFNSNGDYLTRKKLEELAEAKLSRLNISLYGPNHGEYDTDYLKNSFERIFEVVGARNEIFQRGENTIRTKVVFRHKGWKLPISIFASDFNRIGYDRGKMVRTGETVMRSSPCSAVFNEFNIAWDGTVVPCCNIHPHEETHKQYAIGKVKEGDDIFHIYHSETHRAWRRSLATFGSYEAPCDTCTRLNFPGLESRPEADAFNRTISEIL